MSQFTDQWITIPNWDRFQHYKDREPVWIKLYTELNSKPEWLDLSTSLRGVLTTIWVEFARSSGQLRVRNVMYLCGRSARSSHIKSLNDAGFIEFSASRPLALTRSREKEVREEKKDLTRELAKNARATISKKKTVCPECGVGAGEHTADCPTLERTPTNSQPEELF